MLIGGHVSRAGGLVNAHARGVEIGAEAIQVFNQNPRQWRPTKWKPDDVAEFNALMAGGAVKAVAIHAVYLINCASQDREICRKSLTSLTHALRMGDAIGAAGVVLHPGSSLGKQHAAALKRVGKMLREGLAESDHCPLLLENTAGAGDTLGRSFEDLAKLIDLAGGDDRLGLCLDSCHLLASGFDIRTVEGLTQVMDDYVAIVGSKRLRCVHVNDSMTPLGSNVDRHAPLGTGELGEEGCAAFLSERRFEGLPVLFEGPGFAGKAPTKEDIAKARELRNKGLRARKRRAKSRNRPAGMKLPPGRSSGPGRSFG
jgi:deoxyribonuclease-4